STGASRWDSPCVTWCYVGVAGTATVSSAVLPGATDLSQTTKAPILGFVWFVLPPVVLSRGLATEVFRVLTLANLTNPADYLRAPSLKWLGPVRHARKFGRTGLKPDCATVIECPPAFSADKIGTNSAFSASNPREHRVSGMHEDWSGDLLA